MTKFLTQSFVIVVAIATIFATNVQAQDDGPEGSWYSIPGNAFAFVHLDLQDIADSTSLVIPKDIVMGVENELNQLFQNHTGIRPTELMDVTLVVPTVEAAMGATQGTNLPGLMLVSFSSPVDAKLMGSTLDQGWAPVTVEGRYALINEEKDMAIFHHTDNTLAVGQRDDVQWFIDSRNLDDYSHLDDAMAESEYGQIIVGIDGSKIPDNLTQMLPQEFGVFANMNFAAISFDLVDCIAVDSVIEFETVKNAKQVSKLANTQLDNLRSLVGMMENEALQKLLASQSDLDKAIEPLTELAFYRYGKKFAEETEVQQFRNRVMTHVGIEGIDGAMILMGAIPAIGSAAGSTTGKKFELISTELDAK